MSEPDNNSAQKEEPINTPSQDFALYCESEFERRLNSGVDFDEAQYRKAMALVLDKLDAHEGSAS